MKRFFLLDGLGMPPDTPESLQDAGVMVTTSAYPASQFFMQQMQQVRPSYQPTAADWDAITQICRLVHGMPLGIQLAAAWGRLLSPVEILTEIRNDLHILQTDLQDIPARQRSIQLIFTQTWQRLSEAERSVLMRLAIFRSGFTQLAAATVAAANLPLLASLHDKALLWRTHTGRFELHELLRQFTAETATQAGISRALADAHCTNYMDLLGQRVVDLKGGNQRSTLDELKAEYENIRATWQWAVEQCYIDLIACGMDGMGLFYQMCGYHHAGETAFRLALAGLASVSSAEKSLVNALIWHSYFIRELGQEPEARQLLEQCLSRLERLQASGQDVRAEQSTALLRLGSLTIYINVERAQQLLTESLQLCRAVGDRWQEAQILRELAKNACFAGSLDQAKSYADTSLALRHTLQDEFGMAATLIFSGRIAMEQGQMELAMQYAKERLRISQQIGSLEAIAQALFSLGGTYLFDGQLTEAHLHLQEAHRLAKTVGNLHHENTCALFLSNVVLHQGHYLQAERWAQEALQGAKVIDSPHHRSLALCRIAKLGLVQGHYAIAHHHLTASLTQDRQHGISRPDVLALLGHTMLGLGKPQHAHEYLDEFLQLIKSQGNVQALFQAFPLAASLAMEDGDAAQAVELYTLARTDPLIANSRWYADVVGKGIDAAIATLPVDVVSHAQARGRELAPLECAHQLSARYSKATDR